MQRADPRPSHIVQKPANRRGHDFIIGDIHGCKWVLESLKQPEAEGGLGLRPHKDRLFIVGDLIDRGEESAAIVDTLRQMKRGGYVVHVVRGNHEDMYISATLCIEKIRTNKPDDFQMERDLPFLIKIMEYICNGGQWIFEDRETGELFNHWANYIFPRLKARKPEEEELYQLILDNFYKKICSSMTTLVKNYKRIRQYLASLPYVMAVGKIGTEEAFIVCHADLPINDQALREKMDKQYFTPSGTRYITWAREMNSPVIIAKEEHPRHQNHNPAGSTRVYCGHSPVTNHNAIRKETNTINIDSGGYHTNQFIVVNHTGQTVAVLHKNRELLNLDEKIAETVKQIQAFFASFVFGKTKTLTISTTAKVMQTTHANRPVAAAPSPERPSKPSLAEPDTVKQESISVANTSNDLLIVGLTGLATTGLALMGSALLLGPLLFVSIPLAIIGGVCLCAAGVGAVLHYFDDSPQPDKKTENLKTETVAAITTRSTEEPSHEPVAEESVFASVDDEIRPRPRF